MEVKKIIYSFFLFVIFLVGCTDNKEVKGWEASPTFTKDNQVLYGTEGKFGIINVNGAEQPVFPANQGRLYRIYFLKDMKEHSKYKITATHQETGNTEELIETEIAEETEAKLGFGKAGLWKIDVTVDGEPYTDFVVEVD